MKEELDYRTQLLVACRGLQKERLFPRLAVAL